MVSYCYDLAGIRGRWSAIAPILLWSGVGGQLLTPSCCGQGLVVSYCYHLAVVKGWWSAVAVILLWSGVGGQLLLSSCTILLWSGVGGQLFLSSCRGQGLVVSY